MSFTPETLAKVDRILEDYESVERLLKEDNQYMPLPDVGLAKEALTCAAEARKAAPKGQKALLKIAEDAAKKTLKDATTLDKENKKDKDMRLKLLKEREYGIGHMGPILYGFSTEPADDAKDIYQRWMERALRDNDTWKTMRKEVFACKGEGNTARSFNEKRCKAGWTRMKSHLATA
jgi:hypothetical protein